MWRKALNMAFSRGARENHRPPTASGEGPVGGGRASRWSWSTARPTRCRARERGPCSAARCRSCTRCRGRFGSLRAIADGAGEVSAGWVYCIDLGFPGSLLAALRSRLPSGVRLAYEIGDPARPLLANQARPLWEVSVCAWNSIAASPREADRLIFRGSYLADYFTRIAPRRRLPPWIWLPDGADCDLFRPRRDESDVAALRRVHGLEGRFVVGLVGTSITTRTSICSYGWELAEALARLPADLPMTGVVVGDGNGRAVLEAARDRLGLGDRLRLIGRVPHDVVPTWMNVFDVGLSTETDDPVGWGRTTAKLPEYLACGTPVVCSDVGEAHRWLAASGQTLPYHGTPRPRVSRPVGRAAPGAAAIRIWDHSGRRTGPWRCGCSIIGSFAGKSARISLRRTIAVRR